VQSSRLALAIGAVGDGDITPVAYIHCYRDITGRGDEDICMDSR